MSCCGQVCAAGSPLFCHVDFRLRITLELVSASREFRRKRPAGRTDDRTDGTVVAALPGGKQRASPRCARCRRRWLRSSQVIRHHTALLLLGQYDLTREGFA